MGKMGVTPSVPRCPPPAPAAAAIHSCGRVKGPKGLQGFRAAVGLVVVGEWDKGNASCASRLCCVAGTDLVRAVARGRAARLSLLPPQRFLVRVRKAQPVANSAWGVVSCVGGAGVEAIGARAGHALAASGGGVVS